MAAHIEGKGCAVIDMTGLAQKGGAVVTHVRIADRPEDIHAVRLASGGARLILGCDLVVTGGADSLAKVQPGRTHAVVNAHETVTGDFTRNPDFTFPGPAFRRATAATLGDGAADFKHVRASCRERGGP